VVLLLQLTADGQNEFVKNYLQQREQLMSQQMEQKKRYEGADCGFHALSLQSKNRYGNIVYKHQ